MNYIKYLTDFVKANPKKTKWMTVLVTLYVFTKKGWIRMLLSKLFSIFLKKMHSRSQQALLQ